MVCRVAAMVCALSLGARALVQPRASARRSLGRTAATMKLGDLTGKVAFIAGVADSSGYGWAIAKTLAEAGATITVGTWPPVLNIFKTSLAKGKFDDDCKLSDGRTMTIAKIYPLDAVYDTPEDVPADVKANKRYAGLESFTIQEVADQLKADYGQIDILVHSLANGPEVTKPLLETSRKGYLAANSASAYSFVSLVQRIAPIMPPGKYGIRVNTISAGPLKSRAASAINTAGERSFIDLAIDYSKANSPLGKDLFADDVGASAYFLLCDLSRAVTGVTLYVDNGLHAMGMAVDSKAVEGGLPIPKQVN